jgi:hypothetical protein
MTPTNHNGVPMDSSPLPVLIFQMGKVGSQTLQHTLANSGIPCISVHGLSYEGIDYTERTVGVTKDTRDRRSIRRLIDLGRGRMRWKVITLVRDPVARLVSDAFQNGPRYLPDAPPLEDGVLAYGAIVDFIRRRCRGLNPFSTTDFCTWFDLELRKVFDFDIFSVPFTGQEYQVYRTANADILLLKLETFNQTIQPAIMELLNTTISLLVYSNVGAIKPYRRLYDLVLDTLTIPAEDLDRIYQARYVRHFYSPAQIDGFRRRWLLGRTAQPSDAPVPFPIVAIPGSRTENAAKPAGQP